MSLFREVRIGHVIGPAVKGVNLLQVRELGFRGELRPILAVGHEQERPGCGQGRDLGVVGLVVRSPVNRHPALADASAEEMGGDLANRHRDLDPVVNGR